MPPTDAKPAGKTLPFIGLGPCIWRDSPNGEAAPAMVTQAGQVISCIVFPPDSKIGVPKDSVRHVSDPDYARFAVIQSGAGGNPPGVWDFTDEQKQLHALTQAANKVK